MYQCKAIGCTNPVKSNENFHEDFCVVCAEVINESTKPVRSDTQETLSSKYPNYYKPVGDMSEIDVYAVHHLFNIQDPSGCIQHSSKKLLLSGVRTGGKSAYKDIKEARDTLTRWLQLNPDNQ